jgi:prepilin-type N-terminal cleavage/methylation domain-containing protein
MIARCGKSRRGFTLTEMLAVLILFTAFAVIAERLMTTTWRVSYKASVAQNQTASIEKALAALRADTWAAQKITAKDATSTELDLGGGKVIAWSIHDGKFSRREGNREDHWQAPPDAALSSDGAALVLSVSDPKKDIAANRIQMVSQTLLLAKMTR